MNAKSVIGVIIVAILIGVLFVVFEKTLTGGTSLNNSQSSSSQETAKETTPQVQKQTSILNLPSPEAKPAPITGSTDLTKEAQGLQMRDYSSYFEKLKDALK